MRRTFIGILMIISAVFFLSGNTPLKWQEFNEKLSDNVSLSERYQQDNIDVYSSNGNVIIRLKEKSQVKIFTILGQLVSNEELPVGTWELKINSRGIYIIKIGNHTQKIAL
ncbi:MAG: T9SS type A sorting domain-containing protein [Muribaculaceae bacterium]|nr:T9SS type A sorting domain-containing protein [Muribaculaceae bacterium]